MRTASYYCCTSAVVTGKDCSAERVEESIESKNQQRSDLSETAFSPLLICLCLCLFCVTESKRYGNRVHVRL